jgi:hypothetical protein
VNDVTFINNCVNLLQKPYIHYFRICEIILWQASENN